VVPPVDEIPPLEVVPPELVVSLVEVVPPELVVPPVEVVPPVLVVPPLPTLPPNSGWPPVPVVALTVPPVSHPARANRTTITGVSTIDFMDVVPFPWYWAVNCEDCAYRAI
jgi:hypothetical protein